MNIEHIGLIDSDHVLRLLSTCHAAFREGLAQMELGLPMGQKWVVYEMLICGKKAFDEEALGDLHPPGACD